QAERARLLAIADEAARNALHQSPDLAEGHAVRGSIEQSRWHLRSALEELKRALEINPNLALAHHWRSINLYVMGDPAGALREDELARRLDPLAPNITATRASFLWDMRDDDAARGAAAEALAVAP